ncbi:capsular polysaccharide biosynthesis protein [Flavobacterium saliperosum S13]|uniref:protein-tyrosine-phosphatase n=2 Tax=Flavobacterium saliperosum TaxID=329186 RepID=A0A1G4VQE0_9FLAO|nr:CpsB/CapC family capsule biosynthesis tyrosine phosphatase [Flavobacterium saliperosum]ESU23532.1 capsular polysaccharide biosynthesis protein [Flavobacterium saliperosum S13]SCX09734.1 Tyrosine-protein phosphatase YwqE [Flavobacterium saliperosum]
MLSFLKAKPVLKDLIPDEYVDIHSHVLFGIDDGAKTIEDSNFLMQSMLDMRFSKCITTPHTIEHVWDNSRASILEKHREVSAISPDLSEKIGLQVASEYMMNESFVTLFQSEPLLTLKGNYVLVEMSYLNPPIQLYDILFKLQLAGYTPVLAHPERYAFFHHNFPEYKKLKKAGCLFQLNLLSTMGYYGPDVTEAAEKLLKKGMIDFTGSDAHHKTHIEAFSKKIRIKDFLPVTEAMKNNGIFR